MLFWIFVITFVIGLVLFDIGMRHWDYGKHRFLCLYDDVIALWGGITSIISGIVIVIMIIVIAVNHTGVDGFIAQNQERYKILTYKVESGACRDEFGLLNKSVIDEIQEWNEDVVRNKALQNDFWLGIFHPDIYDEFKTIDYTKYKAE